MGKLRKIPLGNSRAKIGLKTFNELVESEEQRRLKPAELVDARSPKSKSPVLVQLAWYGDEPIEPGDVVKLTSVLFEPAADESAPFSGLAFRATAFAENEELVDYAVALGPMAARVKATGTLTSRDDDDTGTLTMDNSEHGISSDMVVELEWDGGRRLVEVGAVAGESVPIDHGSGDVLPEAPTPVVVNISTDVSFGFMPAAYWARVAITDTEHTHAKIVAAGTLLASAPLGGLRIVWKPANTGEAWCVVSLVVTQDRKVAADPTDRHPKELIDKLFYAGTFDSEEHQEVFAQTVLDPGESPDNLIRLFTAKSDGSESPLRAFELVERKYRSEGAATVRWLNHDLEMDMTGDPATVEDPNHLFAGIPRTYDTWETTFDRGMIGLALRRGDRRGSKRGVVYLRAGDDDAVLTLDTGHGITTGATVDVVWDGGEGRRNGMTVGTVAGDNVPVTGGTGDVLPATTTLVHVVNQAEELNSPIWSIIAMEGFATWIKGTLQDASEGNWEAVIGSVKRDEGWDHIAPSTYTFKVANDTEIHKPVDGGKALLLLDDTDTDPPMYRVVSGRELDRRALRGQAIAAVSPGDTTFYVDNVFATEGGYDPTGGNPALNVLIENTYAQSYLNNEIIEADWIAELSSWVARRKGSGPQLEYVAITTGFDGATWSGSAATNDTITVYPFVGNTIDHDIDRSVTVGLAVTVTVSEGKFKRGIILGDHLLQVQCTEWNLPEGWGE